MTYNDPNQDPTPEEIKKLVICILLYVIIILLSNIFYKYGFN